MRMGIRTVDSGILGEKHHPQGLRPKFSADKISFWDPVKVKYQRTAIVPSIRHKHSQITPRRYVSSRLDNHIVKNSLKSDFFTYRSQHLWHISPKNSLQQTGRLFTHFNDVFEMFEPSRIQQLWGDEGKTFDGHFEWEQYVRICLELLNYD